MCGEAPGSSYGGEGIGKAFLSFIIQASVTKSHFKQVFPKVTSPNCLESSGKEYSKEKRVDINTYISYINLY